ncbi:AMP-binding protein, partial [Lysinibacillus fusiformis]|uniref:AMP-binding protein n=1 Tax=Lysinibacillus fusiformis TaxID=28031 RepID=UPI0020C0CBCC
VERYDLLNFLRNKTLLEEPDIIAQRFPHHLAVVEGNRRLTYEEMLQEIEQLSTGFLSLGWQQGDRVLMQLPN